MCKDVIAEFSWALQSLYDVEPSLPVHNSSLYKIFSSLIPDEPEGRIWLVVYDFKALLQQLCFLIVGPA